MPQNAAAKPIGQGGKKGAMIALSDDNKGRPATSTNGDAGGGMRRQRWTAMLLGSRGRRRQQTRRL
ncbi:hypothetical protein E2562_030196 [Oryza meyeriana var. granulata]|uniref:Uncharacterized protein n=1 Tax=Oryza meyeriana var. granulata TaxID=110450 RepID=A0A6G1D9T6_9ORYZ|nr:hypothetical protein E2562_030196 [Oryza meyeriana var. granulata]